MIETERLTYLDHSFDKLILLPSNLELPRMEIKIQKNYLHFPYNNCKWSTATVINLFSSVINDNSAEKLSEVSIKSSSTKSYLSIVSFFVH